MSVGLFVLMIASLIWLLASANSPTDRASTVLLVVILVIMFLWLLSAGGLAPIRLS